MLIEQNAFEPAVSDLDYRALYRSIYADFDQKAVTVCRPAFSMIKAQQDSHQTVDPAVPHVILRTITRSAMTYSSVDCGEGTQALNVRPGAFYMAPAAAAAQWEAEGSHDITLLAVPQNSLPDLLNPDQDADDPLRGLYNEELSDPMIARLIEEIWQVGQQDSWANTLHADGLFLTLMSRLLHHAAAADTPKRAQRRTGRMDPPRLQRVTEFIEANLDDTLSLEVLAQVACLSQHHFARVFRATVGLAPHAYVMSRRVARGRALLEEGEMALAMIAQACGFASQAHFSTVFKRATGLPPAAYRKEHA